MKTKRFARHASSRHFFIAMALGLACSTMPVLADELPPAVAQPGSATTTPAIRNLAKSIGPEAVLDMMFSSIDPICQKTLLSKGTSRADAPNSIEEMRDNKYLLPAIATSSPSAPSAKNSDEAQRSQAPVNGWADYGKVWNWIRLDKQAESPANAKRY